MIKANELQGYLEKYAIPDWLFSLNGGGDDELIGLKFLGAEWTVYSASHGMHIVIKKTEDETDAVQTFLYHLSKQAEAYGYALPLPD